MITLAEAKASSRLRRVMGSCSGTDDYIDLLNDSVRMLVNRGDWYGTVAKVCGCVYNGCVVWPREVDTVLAINQCNNSVPVHNHWFRFDRVERADILDFWACGMCGRVNGVQGNTSPVFNPINCKTGTGGAYLRFYPSQPSDAGKTITVFGVDSNGQTLRSQYPDGTFQDGIVVSLSIPYGQLTTDNSTSNVPTIRHITRILKDITNGPVHAYQYDPINDGPGEILRDLASWGPTETDPQYQTTDLRGYSWAACVSGCPVQISALVKLKFIPAVYDNDVIIIDNLDAIAMMAQSIKLGDAYDANQKRQMEFEAVRELNLSLRRKYPLDQLPVELTPFGTALPGRSAVGRMT